MNDFQKKLKEIPQNAQAYLTSMKGVDLDVAICEKYGIENEKIKDFADLVSQLFFNELELKELISQIKFLFSFADKKARDIAIDIAGIRLLIIKDWLKEDVEKYIKNLGGNSIEFYKYIEEQKKAIKEEEEFFKKELEQTKPFAMTIKHKDIPKRNLNIKQERDDSIEMLAMILLIY